MPWGGYLLGRKAALPLRDRELVHAISYVCNAAARVESWAARW